MGKKLIGTENNIVFYEDENNNIKVEVRLLDEDVWLNVKLWQNLFVIVTFLSILFFNVIY